MYRLGKRDLWRHKSVRVLLRIKSSLVKMRNARAVIKGFRGVQFGLLTGERTYGHRAVEEKIGALKCIAELC